MTKFEVGKRYVEYDGMTYEVTNRTENFVTVKSAGGNVIRRKPRTAILYGCEWIALPYNKSLYARDEVKATVKAGKPEESTEPSAICEEVEVTPTMTEITEKTLEGYRSEIEKIKTRPEAESFLKCLTVKELKAFYKYSVMFAYGEWYRMRKAELIEALLDYYGSVWEEKTETTEQIIAEIESAETLSEIRAVLNECTKAELHEVYERITGGYRESDSWKKSNLVSWYSLKILAHKERETQESEKQNEDAAEVPEGTQTMSSTWIGNAIAEARAECEALQKDPEILGTSFIVGKRYEYGGNEYELIERDWHTLKFKMNGEKIIRRYLKGAAPSSTGKCAECINGLPGAGIYTYADEAVNNVEIVSGIISEAGELEGVKEELSA